MNMPEVPGPGKQVNIAFLGANHYMWYSLHSLLQELSAQRGIRLSINSYTSLDEVLEQKAIDLFFFTGPESGASYECLNYANELRDKYPETIICMCSNKANSLFFARSNIDAWLSLTEPMSVWRESIYKIIGLREGSFVKRKPYLLLTKNEWKVLHEIRAGHSLQRIAEKNQISYRQASALKNTATRKLGLRNKTELLVFLTR